MQVVKSAAANEIRRMRVRRQHLLLDAVTFFLQSMNFFLKILLKEASARIDRLLRGLK